MKHTYRVSGMTCNGCLNHVRETLLSHSSIVDVSIDLESGLTEIEMTDHVLLDELQQLLADSNYNIHPPEEEIKEEKKEPVYSASGKYYCPMRCEGEKLYDAPGDCPVCGMDLVPLDPVSGEDDTYSRLLKKLWVAVLFTVPIFVISMSEMIPNNPFDKVLNKMIWNWIQFALSIPVVFFATRMFFERAYASIRRRSLNMFTLIGIGAGMAWCFSLVGLLFPQLFPAQFKMMDGTVHMYFEASTVILTLALLGQVLEARAHKRTNSAVQELLNMAPQTAFRVVGKEVVEVSVDVIEKGDLILVKAGGRIPVDGTITEGLSTVDESMISGEPIPVDKGVGDIVHAGTINGNNSLVFRADAVGKETLLSQIVDMVNAAGMSQAPIQKVADKISSYFVPIVIGVSILTFVLWLVFGSETRLMYAFVNAVAVLIIACPCALGLATPMSVMVGIGRGAQLGVLIKNAESLQKMNGVDTLIIDKTGTVTEGRPSVEKMVVGNGNEKQNVIQKLASVNRHSDHPLAKATTDYATSLGLSFQEVKEFESITGKGVRGVVDQQQVWIGNLQLMEEQGFNLSDELKKQATEEQSKGKTVPYIAVDGDVIGFVVIYDAIKSSSKNAIRSIQSKGINVVMMTGDNEYTAANVASEIGVKSFHANCLPQDKMAMVERLQNEGKVVAMVGDGINDAPALALSDVGIAMGTGTDIAIESAEITLIKGDLQGVVRARALSEKVMSNIKQKPRVCTRV